jgi:hypothetical protein
MPSVGSNSQQTDASVLGQSSPTRARLQPTLAIAPGPNRARGGRHRLPRIQTLLVDHSIISGNVGNIAFVNFQYRSLTAGDSSGKSQKP